MKLISNPLSTCARVCRLLLWALAFSAPAMPTTAEPLTLASYFTDNMVLQKGAVTTIRGTGEPGKYVSLSYQGRQYGPKEVDHSGNWNIPMELTQADPRRTGNLVVSVGTKKALAPQLQLTNVAVGEVWFLGVLNEKGIPAPVPRTEGELAPHRNQSDFLRFITVRDLTALSNAPAGQSPAWEIGSPDSPHFTKLSALAYYWSFHIFDQARYARQYIGIVQTQTNDIVRWLGGRKWKFYGDRASHYTNRNDLRITVRHSAAMKVEEAQRARRRALIEAKHSGIVREIPPIFQYGDPLKVFPAEALRHPSWLPAFDGAVW